ncbi:MAG: cytochrome C oxidase subunit I [Betaproteobacteria bacterium HGW-Betaproteobacteria-14]|nr:MAG: cytochrome C oxidase subunit I [Betaproteobacteria bacterium HGW-Betaproteobacteria-14]
MTTVAPATDFSLPEADFRLRGLARGWLWLGLLALIGSGVLSIVLVLSRAPQFQHLLPVGDFFRVALVVHVDLSVLVWFVSLGGILWTLSGNARALGLNRAALVISGLGTLLMTLSPFIGRGGPVMANYIPVLEDPVFLWGLVIFGAGSVLLVGRSLVAAPAWAMPRDGAEALRSGLALGLLPAVVAIIAFAWSWLTMPGELSGKAYYEILFWGGGHALQFIWAVFMLVAWLWLASACGARVPMTPRIALLCFFLATVCAVAIPVAYLLWPAHAVEHRNLLTFAMGLGGGLPILPVALAALLALRSGAPLADEARPLRAALLSSIALFCFGGLIGFTIAGNNVKIPAHYHGCIVGVTLALMGLVYHLLPRLGYGMPARKWATFSSYCYAVGQAMHIGGLMWSGGYGVQRKVAGAEQALKSTSEIAAMGIMGLGGLVAIIGGLIFVVVVLMAIRRGGRAAP